MAQSPINGPIWSHCLGLFIFLLVRLLQIEVGLLPSVKQHDNISSLQSSLQRWLSVWLWKLYLVCSRGDYFNYDWDEKTYNLTWGAFWEKAEIRTFLVWRTLIWIGITTWLGPSRRHCFKGSFHWSHPGLIPVTIKIFHQKVRENKRLKLKEKTKRPKNESKFPSLPQLLNASHIKTNSMVLTLVSMLV